MEKETQKLGRTRLLLFSCEYCVVSGLLFTREEERSESVNRGGSSVTYLGDDLGSKNHLQLQRYLQMIENLRGYSGLAEVGDRGTSGGGGTTSPLRIPAGQSRCGDGGAAAVDPTIRNTEQVLGFCRARSSPRQGRDPQSWRVAHLRSGWRCSPW